MVHSSGSWFWHRWNDSELEFTWKAAEPPKDYRKSMADNQIHILLWQDPSGTSIEWLMKKQLHTTRLVKRLMEWVRNNELREWQENERTQTARSTPSLDCKAWLAKPRASGLTLSLSKSQGRSFQYYIGLISAEPTFDFSLYKNWILGQ